MVSNLKLSFDSLLNIKFISILFLGFSAGIPLALTGSLLSMWLSRLEIDVKTIGLFSLVAIPFTFKYLWSSIFDYIPIPFFTKKIGLRRSWLILTQFILIISIIVLGNTSPLESITITAICAIAVSFASASQDIIIDALRIEVLEEKEQALGATMYVYGYRIAILVSGGGALLLADHFTWKIVYFIMSLTIILGIIGVFIINEPNHPIERINKIENFKYSFSGVCTYLRESKWISYTLGTILFYGVLHYTGKIFFKSESNTIINVSFFMVVSIIFYMNRFSLRSKLPEPILDFSNNPNWFKIFLYIILYKMADTLVSTVQSKFYVTMGFSNTEIAYITKGLGTIMTMLGLFVGGVVYYKIGTFKSLLFGGVLQMLSNLIFIWVGAEHHNLIALTSAIAIENFTSAISNIVIVAYLSSLCNVAYTATQYALLSSLSNVGRTIIAAPAGYVVDYLGWNYFFVFTAIAGIPAIYLIIKIFNNTKANA